MWSIWSLLVVVVQMLVLVAVVDCGRDFLA
jgi:hypothetical protein